MLAFGPVLILNALVRHFEGTSTLEMWTVWLMVTGMFVLPFMGSVIAAHSNGMMAHIGIQIRNALINAIYRKAMRLSPAARQTPAPVKLSICLRVIPVSFSNFYFL